MKLLPVAPEYQFTIPALAVAPNVTVPVPHLEAGVVPVIDGIAFTDIVIAFDDAGLPDGFDILEVRTHVIISPSANAASV